MKKNGYILAGTALALLLAGCSSNSAAPSTSNGSSSTAANEIGDKDAVTLCDYKNIEIERYVDEITEETLQEYIQEEYDEVGEYITVDRGAKEGDNVEVAMKLTSGEEILEEYPEDEFTSVIVGDKMYGDEFDQNMKGIKAGETREFTFTFPSDAYEYADMEVKFSVKALDVQELHMPEKNEEFYTENFGVKNEEEFIALCKKELEETYETYSNDELEENLLMKVIEDSTGYSYTQETYNTAKEEVTAEYMDYAKEYLDSSMEEMMEAFGITEADLEEEIILRIKRNIVVAAIIEKEGLTITDTEYTDFVKELAEYYGYDTPEEFTELYEEDIIRDNIMQIKVLDLLKSNAKITDVPRPEEEEPIE